MTPEQEAALAIVRNFEAQLREGHALAPVGIDGEVTRASCHLQILECKLAEAQILSGKPAVEPEEVRHALDVANVPPATDPGPPLAAQPGQGPAVARPRPRRLRPRPARPFPGRPGD